jgi:plastocyanin
MKNLLIAAACGLCFACAHAGTVQVTVTDKDGRPVPDVVVLVETAAKAGAAPVVGVAAPVVIAQDGLRFVPFLSVVPTGSTLRFVNRDGYDHHVRSVPSGPLGSMPPAKNFELRLDAAAPAAASADAYKAAPAPRKRSGATQADVTVDQAGPIGLGCHLHSSMRGQVYVSATPWFGKTDANGVANIDGVPDGNADLNLWHPDQLQEQPALRVQVGPGVLKAAGQLNFTPRRRRS